MTQIFAALWILVAALHGLFSPDSTGMWAALIISQLWFIAGWRWK